MGIDTKGIVFGERTIDEIAAAVTSGYGPATVHPIHDGDVVLGRVGVTDKSLGDRCHIFVCIGTDSSDNASVYAGARTFVSLGFYGDSVAIIESVLNAFGGYILDSDSEDDWRVVEGKAALELSPRDRLLVDVGRDVGVKQASLVRDIVDDPAKVEALANALESYREAALADAPSPR